jgi:hypothetical protein
MLYLGVNLHQRGCWPETKTWSGVNPHSHGYKRSGRSSRSSRDLILSWLRHRYPSSSHVSYLRQTRKSTPVIIWSYECVEGAGTDNS